MRRRFVLKNLRFTEKFSVRGVKSPADENGGNLVRLYESFWFFSP